MRTTRLLILIGVLTAAAGALALPSPVRASEPLRSGTIVSGTGETPVNPWVTGMEGCVGAPTCAAWLQSGCAPALAGADPALHASIVDVADLADGVTQRSLAVPEWGPLPLGWGDFIVQFWTGTGMDEYDVVDEPAGLDGQGCLELLAKRITWRTCEAGVADGCSKSFRIPTAAKFMTINTRPENRTLQWTLI